MIEIKFRIYTKHNNEMDYFTLDNDFDCHVGWLVGCKLDQYTGLKDKDGIEIYINDIINVPYNHIGLHKVTFGGGKCNISHYKISRCSIVGNVYQNKDLLDE